MSADCLVMKLAGILTSTIAACPLSVIFEWRRFLLLSVLVSPWPLGLGVLVFFGVSSGPVRHLPGRNSSYKRDIILRFGNELDLLMEAESVLHRHLTAEGHRLTLESRTCTTHLNFTSWSAWIPLRYHIGRQFAAIWSHSWSWPRRLLFTVASPLIPWVRLWRIQKNIRRVQSCNFLITVLPVVFLGLLIELCGQMLGFAFGPADSSEKVAKYEYRRFR